MASLLDLAQARLQGLLDIPTRAARAIVNPTAFSGLLGAPTLPQMQGTAEAAYGLPARQNMSVLDPKQAAYLQGYQQGEPLAYLGAATPFAAPAAVAGAKAVAPKAGMALENYMASQGLLQPLTAYHGTPHTIRGKFDISKVGTGEGSQAYGHGMYFAENPKVAIGYRDALAVDPNMASENLQFKTLQAFMPTEKKAVQKEIQSFIDGTGNYNNFVRVINQEGSDALKKALLKEEPNLFSAGNLYKVDIPDEYIPKMLDWDKPLGQQNKQLQKAIEETKKFVTKEDLDNLGGDINLLYNKDTDVVSFLNTWADLRGKPNAGEELLSKVGVKGIRYLDAGSREVGKGTSNFVVFDPTDVKILEKNSQKVEGLLD